MSSPTCPLCFGPPRKSGAVFGDSMWYCCRDCGVDWSQRRYTDKPQQRPSQRRAAMLAAIAPAARKG